MDLWQYLLLIGIGLVCGIINVIAGGGSLVTLPVMIFMGLPEAVANGTNRVAILAQNITSVEAFRQKGFSDFKLSCTLGLCTIPGAVAGAWCGAIIRGELFNQILALVMVGVVILMATQKKTPTSAAPPEGHPTLSQKRIYLGHLSMVVIGFYGGFIQAGVGFLIMAALHQVMHLDLIQVNMHKVFVTGLFTLVALVVFVVMGKVWWLPGIALASGNAVGGWIGAHLTVSKGEVLIRRCLFATLLLMALQLLFG
jgi:uncharacterized protein